MKYWKASGINSVILEEAAPEQVRGDRVKLKMLASAITETELLLYEGKFGMKSFPRILGRQGVGMVSEVGSEVMGLKRGDRVYVRPQIYCGKCSKCRGGNPELCAHREVYGKTADGLLRDFVVASMSELYKLPDKIDTHEASLLETISVAKNVVDKAELKVGDYVIVSGASCLGLLVAQAAIYCQAIPIVLDINPARLSIAEKLGIYYAVDVGAEDAYRKIFAITGGKLADAAVYTLPEILPFRRLFDCISTGGKVIFAAIDSENVDVSVNIGTVLDKNVTVSTVSSNGLNITAAINMLAGGKVKVSPFISRCNFMEVNSYLRKMADDPRRYMFLTVVF